MRIVVLGLLSVSFVAGCVTNENGVVDINQVYQFLPIDSCEFREEKFYLIAKNFRKNFSGDESLREQAVAGLSLVPEEYTNWLLKHWRIKIKLVDSPYTGKDKFRSRTLSKNRRPKRIFVTNIKTSDLMLKEIGRSVYAYLSPVFPELKQDVLRARKEFFSLAEDRDEEAALGGAAEFFAELFANHYCSEKTRDVLGSRSKTAAKIASDYLIPSDKLTFGKTKDTPQGTAKIIDADGDGIPNRYDRCKKSPFGDDVRMHGAKVGCR